MTHILTYENFSEFFSHASILLQHRRLWTYSNHKAIGVHELLKAHHPKSVYCSFSAIITGKIERSQRICILSSWMRKRKLQIIALQVLLLEGGQSTSNVEIGNERQKSEIRLPDSHAYMPDSARTK
jgi:hypothetical protein